MLLPARHLVRRLRPPRSREADSLRRRLAAMPTADEVPGEEVRLARELATLREELSTRLAGVRACSTCAAPHPAPHGRFDGGFCCGGSASELFGDDELAALRLSGTLPSELVAAMATAAGCVFRGPSGCTLAPRSRPSLCVRFVCRELGEDLVDRGLRAELSALEERLFRGSRELGRLRGARLERQAALREPA